jgi:hypothetical protein
VGRLKLIGFGNRDLVIAMHFDLGPEHKKCLYQVIGKRIVIIND